jgi:hypothetical protein
MCAMPLFYHISPAQSTLSSAISKACSPTSYTFEPRGRQGSGKMQIPMLFKQQDAETDRSKREALLH